VPQIEADEDIDRGRDPAAHDGPVVVERAVLRVVALCVRDQGAVVDVADIFVVTGCSIIIIGAIAIRWAFRFEVKWTDGARVVPRWKVSPREKDVAGVPEDDGAQVRVEIQCHGVEPRRGDADFSHGVNAFLGQDGEIFWTQWREAGIAGGKGGVNIQSVEWACKCKQDWQIYIKVGLYAGTSLCHDWVGGGD
jgi:hypothetical protein